MKSIIFCIFVLNIVCVFCSETQIYTDISQVSYLTFNNSKYNFFNQQQMECIGGDACNWSNLINSIKCINYNQHEYTTKWRCSVLNKNFEIVSSDVICMHKTNTTIMVNSCYVKYVLSRTQLGKENYFHMHELKNFVNDLMSLLDVLSKFNTSFI